MFMVCVISKRCAWLALCFQVCDSDTMLDPACSVEMAKVLEEDTMVGGVGGDVQVLSFQILQFSSTVLVLHTAITHSHAERLTIVYIQGFLNQLVVLLLANGVVQRFI